MTECAATITLAGGKAPPAELRGRDADVEELRQAVAEQRLAMDAAEERHTVAAAEAKEEATRQFKELRSSHKKLAGRSDAVGEDAVITAETIRSAREQLDALDEREKGLRELVCKQLRGGQEVKEMCCTITAHVTDNVCATMRAFVDHRIKENNMRLLHGHAEVIVPAAGANSSPRSA